MSPVAKITFCQWKLISPPAKVSPSAGSNFRQRRKLFSSSGNHPLLELGCLIFADIDSFRRLHVQPDEQAAVEPDGKTFYAMAGQNELLICPYKARGVKMLHDLIQCFGVRKYFPVPQDDRRVFICCIKARDLLQLDGKEFVLVRNQYPRIIMLFASEIIIHLADAL